MQKKFSNSDITVRPFKTYKNWTIQTIDSSSTDIYGDSTYYDDKLTINQGIKISGSFYPSSSAYYNVLLEPVNSTGEYKRITWAATDALFYRNLDNPLNQFGVEFVGQDPITKNREIREISDTINVVRISRNFWGDKISPETVRITDYSSPHEVKIVADDGYTNLFLSGSYFPTTTTLYPYNQESSSYWVSGSGEFYYNGNLITYEQAQQLKDAGGIVDYVPSSTSWEYNITGAVYHPEDERFGYSVSAWYKYAIVGSPTDENTYTGKKNGRADLYKYDTNTEKHRLIKTFRSPFTNSYQDGFGYSVSVKDDFVVIGSVSESACLEETGSGIVYVYDKYAGGADHWRLINILEGSGSGDRFGESVSHDRGILAIGAPGVDSGSGAVYVYRQKQYGTSSCMGVPMESFWQKVSSESGSCYVLVSESGSLEVFGEDEAPYFVSGNYTWELERILTSSYMTGSQFGSSVSVSTDRILIGTHVNGKGYASLFTASYTDDVCPTASWHDYKTFTATTTNGDLDALSEYNFQETSIDVDGFGYKVSIDGDQLGVCSYYDKAFTPYVGSNVTHSLGAVYFYTFATDETCGIYDCSLRYKTFGDRTTTLNSNFARSISLNSGFASVGYTADTTEYYSAYSSGFVIPGWESYSTNSLDESATLGRVSLFEYNPQDYSWSLKKTLKRNKEFEQPYYNYGWSTALSDPYSGSMFLVVGAPVFDYPLDEVTFNHVTSSLLIDTTYISSSLHGAAYIYDIEKYEDNPKIGNVFYKNGQLVITSTEPNYSGVLSQTGSSGFSLSYKGTHTIYEHEYLLSVEPGEFNYSTNPTSLANFPMVFDVNQDGVFDMTDVDLILRFLNKQRFYTVNDTDDNGIVLEQDTLKDESWWNNDILQTESEDVLYLETLAGIAGTAITEFDDILTQGVYDFIRANLIDTMILDIDNNGTIDIRDGLILLYYFLETLTEAKLTALVDADSQRIYYDDVKNYMDKYSGKRKSDSDANFFNYVESSSFDPTGSYLAPYITAVGLYNDAGELLVVGKLGKPIKNLIDWPVNIILRFDT